MKNTMPKKHWHWLCRSVNLSFNCNALPNFVSVMVEAFANEVTSERFCEALRFAFIKVQYNIIYKVEYYYDNILMLF